MFSNHVEAFDLQDRLSGSSFTKMMTSFEERDEVADIPMPQRDFKPIDNLLYSTPVAAAEATTPLAGLLAMFEGDDSGPIRLAGEWQRAGLNLLESMAELASASTALGSSAEGYSFDMARSAIDSVVSTGTTVGNNAVLMGASMSEFPGVRIANLNALRAIQASTSTIIEPAARLAAEQSAVATFVSTQLQPSLELLRPPVANLGVPVTGHTGGGVLDAATHGQSSTPTTIHTPHGGHLNAGQAATTNLGAQAHTAAANAPTPTGTVAPASAAHVPISPTATAASPVNGLAPGAASTAGVPTTFTPGAENAGAARPAGLGPASAPASGAHPGQIPNTTSNRVRGGVGHTTTGTNSNAGRGSGPVVPQLPGQQTPRNAAHANSGLRTGMLNVGLGHGNGGIPGAGRGTFGPSMGAVGSGTQGGGLVTGAPGHAGHATGAPGHAARGGAGTHAGLGGHRSAKNAKAAAGIFGKGAWTPGVSEYFKRQFLGDKKRTVKEVIR